MKQGVKPDSMQYYNIHKESILSDLVTRSDIYDKYSYASFVDWENEKRSEAHPKKLEFNIDKLEIDLKMIDFNINVNDDGIDDHERQKVVHLSDDLTDDE